MRFALCLTAFSVAAVALAHEIPNDVTVRLLVAPRASVMGVSVRVPLKAIRDMEFPEQGSTGFLDLEKLAPLLPDAATLWISGSIAIRENNVLLAKPRLAAMRIALPSEREFNFAAPPLTNSANVVWNQVNFDVLFEYPIQSDRGRFAIRPGLEKLGERVVTALVFSPPNGTPRPFEFEGDPGFVELDPHWSQAAARFVRLGFFHILDGADHLLFLLCLIANGGERSWRRLLLIVTAFTAAHSFTLIASAYGLAPDALWFPPLVEMLIAASIVVMALENIVASHSFERRWALAFGFGLIHGFGFSFALRDALQFAGAHHLGALLVFNIGVELGQVLVLALLGPLLALLFRYVVAERLGTLILSAFVAHTGWHWLLERWEVLGKFHIGTDGLPAAPAASLLKWLIVLLLFGAAARVLLHRLRAWGLRM